eukprot:4678811-Prorocentrum_lima.AAC.1
MAKQLGDARAVVDSCSAAVTQKQAKVESSEKKQAHIVVDLAHAKQGAYHAKVALRETDIPV